MFFNPFGGYQWLVRFCKRHKTHITYSQLEPANLIAVVAQYLMRTKVVAVRHHVDEVEATSTGRAHRVSILTYKLARHVVVVSRRAKGYMTTHEGINPSKIHHVPLGYNFQLWPKIDPAFIRKKREQLGADFILIAASRLVSGKRVDLAVRLLSMFVHSGVNCKLIVLGQGDQHENLTSLSTELGVTERVYFEGYVNNVLDYICMADIMVHFSLIDSSPAIIKEAGLAAKPVIVCRDVGDCDDYIEDGVNGFLVDRDNPLTESFLKAQEYYNNKKNYEMMGSALKISVMKTFSITFVLPKYRDLNRLLLKRLV